MKKTAVLCASILVSGSLYAQQDTGVVTGQVVTSQGGNSVEGAIVRIKELGRQTSTQSDGSYRIGAIEPGTYTLEVDYLGAGTQSYQITVEAGGRVTQLVQLQGDDFEVIEVEGNFASLNSARNLQRAADVVKDVVDASLTGRFADLNVAESLQRLPGVNIDRSEGEGRFVTIRGLGPEFNSVSVNGVTMGSSSSGFDLTGSAASRAVALDIIPADLIETIEVSKTRTPDMDGDSIGGQIELKALSAYDRGGYSFDVRVDGSYQEISGDTSPRASFKYTDFIDDDKKWGIALSGSYFDRSIEGEELRNGEGLAFAESFVDPNTGIEIEDEDARPEFLVIQEIDQRREIGERERWGVTANIDFRPDQDNQYYFRYTGTKLTDHDTRLQQEWEIRDANSDDELLLLRQNGGIVTDVDLEKLTFYKLTEEKVNTFSIGGEHFFSDWNIDYQLAYSKNEFDDFGTRGRFRGDDIAMEWQVNGIYDVSVDQFDGDPDSPPLNAASSSDYPGNVNDLESFEFNDFLYIKDATQDTVKSFTFNAERYIELGDMFGTLKMGIKNRIREKENDRIEEFSADPEADIDEITLNSLDQYRPYNPSTELFGPEFRNFADLRQFRDVMWNNIDLARANQSDNPNAFANTVRGDYTSEEDILAGYVMAAIDVTDEVKVTAGVRVERTKVESSAFETRRIEVGGDFDEIFAPQVLGFEQFTNEQSYTDVLPGVHLRYEPTDDIVIRASYTEGVQRPSFFAAIPRFDEVLDLEGDDIVAYSDADVEVEVFVGNPDLEAASATQWDANLAWYPSETTYVSIGVFYKTIDKFFVDSRIRGTQDIANLGFSGSNFSVENQNTGEIVNFDGSYDIMNITLNGQDATVSGVEFAYSQQFPYGFFIDSNLAIMDSEAVLGEPRPDEKLRLPNQADSTANLSVGWENQKVSVRLSWNYRADILEQVSGNEYEDVIRESYEQADFGVKYRITDKYRVFFDVTNLFEEEDVAAYRGTEATGRLFEKVERYGRTFQLGISGNF
uniref:TonB-dependent receptor n=1 Tax=Ningiella ruwaisensis TaxID=2364274 RepID=UPI001446D119|nr:TonB-dependent receptor [Ningiella ruwaisensis]